MTIAEVVSLGSVVGALVAVLVMRHERGRWERIALEALDHAERSGQQAEAALELAEHYAGLLRAAGISHAVPDNAVSRTH